MSSSRATSYCSRCKAHRSVDMFSHPSRAAPYKTCSSCRTSKRGRDSRINLRRRQIFEAPESREAISAPVNSVHEQRGLEIHNPIENLIESNVPAQIDEVAGGEALADDEPTIILSHVDTREYISLMRIRESLPENHDEIFEQFETAASEIAVNHDTNFDQANQDPFTNRPSVPRRLPQWLASLPNRRQKPAGYVSRYNKNMPLDYAGSCSSVCRFCNALHWPQERVHSSSIANPRFQTCCREGQVILNDIREPPEYLKWLWTSEDREAKQFRKNSIPYNRAFAFTSFNYGRDTRLADMGIRGGIQSFSIRGQVYHQTGAARREGMVPRYAQLYFVDPDEANQARVEGNNLNPDIVRELASMIERLNPFVQHYRTAHDSLLASNLEGPQRVVLNPQFRLVLEEGTDRRRYNLPTAHEFAVVIPDEVESDSRDVILFEREGDGSLSNRFQYINRNHPAYLPLHYVLFYPFGNPGYQFSMRLASRNQRVRGDIDHSEEAQEGNGGGCISARQFYRYHLFSRIDPETNLPKFNALLHGERLFQQICCDMYASVDDNVLNWHRQNQHIIRSDLYSGVIDALRRDRPNDSIGQPVMLASSYVGGDRHMSKCYQNAMAITRALGNPGIFLTITANPAWREISENLYHGQTPDTRPDLISRVFKIKQDKVLHDVKERNILGCSIGSIFSIEYQKRGLPHAHLLLHLHRDDMPKTAEEIDEIVRAQIPIDDPELANIVKTQLTHGPCGPNFPNAPCMRDGKCSKGFPKRWCDETIVREGSYPEYARPDNGVRWGSERFLFDNRWVVPYNPYLTKKYGAHINVEIAGGVRAIKYLAKYIYKGSDRATLAVPGEYNEIEATLQGRYIGPAQAIWRLFGFATHEEKPAVMMLPFHLEGEHRVTFRANQDQGQVAAGIESQSSAFLDWMRYNANNRDGRDLFYSDFPMHYTHIKNRGWHLRKKGHTIGRMPLSNPRQGERFFLRSLLTVKRGATSYEDLYRVNGISYEVPSAACRAWGLTYDDSEWITFFNDASLITPAATLRYQFAVNISDSEILEPQRLWDQFVDCFTDDCLHRIQRMGNALLAPPTDWTDDERRIDYGLWLLGESLRDFGMDFTAARLRGSRHHWVVRRANIMINEALDFDRVVEAESNEQSVRQLSLGQRDAYDTIIDTIENNRRPNSFFLQGPAGTGKTFLYKSLCQLFHSRGQIVLCVASSGIASLLLPNGSTAHSRFKIPIECTEQSMCSIRAQSDLADLLRQTDLIIWDEVTMQNKHNFTAVERTLRDLRHCEDLFGGIPVLMGGDFAQILPVVKRGRREQIVNACLRCWTHWRMVRILFLTENMRVLDGEENRRFATWLSNLSYTPALYGAIEFPDYIQVTNDRAALREFVYPVTQLRSTDTSVFHDRAILASRNDAVERFNDEIAEIRGTESREYFSLDEVKREESPHITDYAPEYLRQITGQGLAAGILKLQVGMPVMLLRNYYSKLGLCNGSRLIITHLLNRGIKGKIISQDPRFSGKEYLISRASMTSGDDVPFTMVRKQLPLRPCFSMTINKSQGQTLKRVGVDLTAPTFTHGQLYVALSRVTDVRNLMVLLPPDQRTTKNVVYPEVLLRPTIVVSESSHP